MGANRREKVRKKLLGLLDRKTLESLSTRPAPWHADKATLQSELLAKWPHDDIADAVDSLVKLARPDAP